MSHSPAPRQSRQNSQDRREKLLAKAEELFARKGIDAVSLNEINKAAQQRNTSALHYYFKNKQGLIKAIIYHHYAAIDGKIIARLDEFEQLPVAQRTPRKLLEAQLLPYAEQLDSPRGVNYLCIVSQVFMKSTEMILNSQDIELEQSRPRILGYYRQLQPELPKALRESRQVLLTNLMFHSLASFAQNSRTSGPPSPRERELFVSNLLDGLEALLLSTPSAQTLALCNQPTV